MVEENCLHGRYDLSECQFIFEVKHGNLQLNLI